MPASRSPGVGSPAGARAAVMGERGQAVAVQAHRHHGVEAQQQQVGPVVPRQPLVPQMRVEAAQAPQAPPAGPQSAPVGQGDRVGVTHHHVLDQPAAIEQHADLAAYLVADLGQVPGELLRDQPIGRHAAPEEALEPARLTGLEAVRVTEDLDGRCLQSRVRVRADESERPLYVARRRGSPAMESFHSARSGPNRGLQGIQGRRAETGPSGIRRNLLHGEAEVVLVEARHLRAAKHVRLRLADLHRHAVVDEPHVAAQTESQGPSPAPVSTRSFCSRRPPMRITIRARSASSGARPRIDA